jgi:DNA-binding FadR family transcriptional regulator
MARAAAQLMSDADLAELKALLDELHGQLQDAERYQDTDTRYHDFIMRCSGNRLGRSIIRAIHPHARASSRYNPPADEEDIRRAHAGHVAIYERLLERDAEGAAAAMQEHIRGTWTLRKVKRA